MKKQNLSSKLTLSKKVISNLQSERIKGGWNGYTDTCTASNQHGACDQAPSKTPTCQDK